MSKPLLSICIPTYNRSEYLKKSIDSIINQKEFLDGKVEIVISDNASEDDTCAMVKEYADKYGNVFYHQNIENILDKNFPIVLSKGHGLLRRLCNDTLIFHPGSLASICKVIEQNIEKRPYICWANGIIKSRRSLFVTDFKGYVRDISFWMTWSACFSLWENECTDIHNDTSGCELCLWQVKKSLEIANKKNVVLISNQVLTVTQTVEKKNISYGLFRVFYENYFILLEPYFINKLLTNEDHEYLEKDILFNFFKSWCVQWELQTNDYMYSQTENLKEAIWKKYKSKPYWIKFLIRYYISLYRLKGRQIIKKLLKK